MSVAKGSINRVNNIRKKTLLNAESGIKEDNVRANHEHEPVTEKTSVNIKKVQQENTSVQFTQELPYYLL